jgi:hypothetical protein
VPKFSKYPSFFRKKKKKKLQGFRRWLGFNEFAKIPTPESLRFFYNFFFFFKKKYRGILKILTDLTVNPDGKGLSDRH